MGDLAKGIKSFKKGLSEDEAQPAPKQLASAADSNVASEARQEAPRS
jgi:Sec-independent protein translocase protein TatA